MHADGYVRERAARALAGWGGELAARFLALRAVDHVEQVRAVAVGALSGRPAVVVLEVLLRVQRRPFGPAALASYAAQIDARELLAVEDLLVRRFAYDRVLDELTAQEVAARLADEPDQLLQSRLAERWMVIDPVTAKRRLLGSKLVEGRLAALYGAADEAFEPAELEELMLDRSSRVRQAARWRYRRSGREPVAFYRSRPQSGSALFGLREIGQQLTEPEARAALASPEARGRLAALDLWPGDAPPRELLLAMLADPSRAVVKRAARLLAAQPGVRYDDVVPAAESDSPDQRRAAWMVRRELGGPSRLRGSLEASLDVDRALAAEARRDLINWLELRAATMYERLHPTEREAIGLLLSRSNLPRPTRERIAFHAGL
ncbi:hypothetical protein HPO96_15840 [Kribbella sandramycini]|uniref:HEAT repeat protein n=1 Tax=Kribbella sandramycini TaxID=60450 RepID=A0A7Y4P144_9ACTN|nr:hypothetical protein [Kribbella sandramycini]MBB6565451.1 hypothetical protein [Kribbella sandramycini]NOL41719.1 hypothetical protein [Kribbella sandramycini]